MRKSPDHNLKCVFKEAEGIRKKWFRNIGPLRVATASYCDLSKSIMDKIFAGHHLDRTDDVIGACAKVLTQRLAISPRKEEIENAIFGSFETHLRAIQRGDYSKAIVVQKPTPPLPISRTQQGDVALQVDLIARDLRHLPAFPNPIDQQTKSRMRKLLAGGSKSPKPYVFYHWRQKHSEIHWVDFYFIHTMQVLQSHGFEACALITTERGALSGQISEIVKKVLGAPPITHTDAKACEPQYLAYAREIIGSPEEHHAILTQREDDTKTWLLFLPYFVHDSERPGYLQLLWKRHYDGSYEYVYSNDDVPVAQLLTYDIKFGEVLAKKDGPPLCIEPMPCPSFRKWLSGSPRPTYEDVETLLLYFDALDNASSTLNTELDESGESHSNLSQEWVNLLGKKPTPRLRKAVARLAVILGRWDEQYFNSRAG